MEKKNILGVAFVLLVIFAPQLLALDPKYERNGEAYLLIGDGVAGKRGVYRLNNPSGELAAAYYGGDKISYDPGSSRGITVNLNRQVFTFTQHTDPNYILDRNRMLSRLMKPVGGCTLYGAHVETRQHYPVSINSGYPSLNDSDGVLDGETAQGAGQPVYTTSGPWGNGNGPNSYSLAKWISWSNMGRFLSSTGNFADDGSNPVHTQKDPRTGYTGWDYFSTCCWANSYWYPGGARFWLYWVPVDGNGYGQVPNDSWWQSRDPDPSARPGNIFYWDRLWEQRIWYDLKNWDQTKDGFGPTAVPGSTTPNLDYTAREYLVRYRISACINCVCVNGGGGNITEPTPKYISIAISPFGRTYQYSRSYGAADAILRLNGTNLSLTNSNIRGEPNDVTTKWVGISEKSTSEDFIYLLGNQTFREWIPALPSTFDADAVSVSDQWNLQGGIVFAYDGYSGYAYQIFRSDNNGGNSMAGYKVLNLGVGLDDLKSDGFGNVYFSKTVKTPADTSITLANAVSVQKVGSSYQGKTQGVIYFNQSVDKVVFKRGVGDSSDTSIGKVNLGINQFSQRFNAADSIWPNLTLATLAASSNLAGWTWFDSAPVAPSVKVNNPDAVQLAVINVGTPPHVENATGPGHIDIVGPASQSMLLTQKYDQGVYSFTVENAPKWLGDDNIILPGKDGWTNDANGNAFTGGFCSSLVNSNTDAASRAGQSNEVLYHWLVYRIQDAIGVATRTLCIEKVDYLRNRLSYYFTPGAYEIHCSAKYKWYDYNSLPFGSTIQDRATCIRPTTGYVDALAASDLSPFNSGPASVTGFVGPIDPSHTAVQVLLIKEGPPLPTNAVKVSMQQAKAVVGSPTYNFPTSITLAAPIGSIQYFVATQSENNLYRIYPASISIIWDLAALRSQISDINMVPGSLEWVSDAQFTWIYTVLMPDGSPGPSYTITKSLSSNVNAEISLALNMPTDPTVGTITCQLSRLYHYMRNVYTYDPDVNQTILLDPIDIVPPGGLQFQSTARMVVLENQPPQIVQVNGSPVLPKDPILLGYTWGLPNTDISWPGYTKPSKISIMVQTNNPFGNYTTTLGIPEAKLNRNVKTTAQFSFERKTTKSLYPASSLDSHWNWYSSPPPNILADGAVNSSYRLVRTPQPYTRGATYSWALYELDLNDLVDLQDNSNLLASDACNRFPWDFANNSDNYQAAGQLGTPHPGYALFLNATDSSGLGTNRSYLGNIWIRDNLPPVPFATITDYANSFPAELVPYNIAQWVRLYNKFPSTPINWAADASGVFMAKGTLTPVADSTVVGIPWGLGSEMTIGYHPPKIQEGMEVFFTLTGTDNIKLASNTGNPADDPRITITGPIAGALYQPDATKTPPSISFDSINTPAKLRALLPYPGVYNCTISASDNAKDFNNNPSPNTRKIDFAIVVSPVTMDIRILERRNEKVATDTK
ncbi:MAG: hypothetical protein HQM08_07385 [Candidatus Riflebacteria bacterium]|nr:hypothetical protein [Candidatus Riflebacteria bacterium]